MGRDLKFTEAQIEEALRASGGIYTGAAFKLECAPNTIKNYIERSEHLQEIVLEIVSENLDIAETALLKAIGAENLTAIIFYLKTKGKNRGYSEKHVVSGPHGGPIPVQHTLDLGDLSKEDRDALRGILERRLKQSEAGSS